MFLLSTWETVKQLASWLPLSSYAPDTTTNPSSVAPVWSVSSDDFYKKQDNEIHKCITVTW